METSQVEVGVAPNLLEPLPTCLDKIEAQGLLEEQRRGKEEELRKQQADEAVLLAARKNWCALCQCITVEIPDSLHDWLPEFMRELCMPKDFTIDTVRWDLQIPLPAGRPPLVARFQRAQGKWHREEWAPGMPWVVLSWQISDTGELFAEQNLDFGSHHYASGLPEALVKARDEAIRLRHLKRGLEITRQRRATAQGEEQSFAPPPLSPPSCCQAERVLLDALRDYLWSNSLDCKCAE